MILKCEISVKSMCSLREQTSHGMLVTEIQGVRDLIKFF
jgi:hypothetical protein